jgi:hypothetical protein
MTDAAPEILITSRYVLCTDLKFLRNDDGTRILGMPYYVMGKDEKGQPMLWGECIKVDTDVVELKEKISSGKIWITKQSVESWKFWEGV